MTIFVRSKDGKSAKLEKLTKILGMLGSAHAGEQSSAATKACQLLKELNMTWDVVVAPAIPATLPISPKRPKGIRGKIQNALASGALTKWERNFLISVSGKPYLSIKQKIVVDRILTRVSQ